MSLARTELESTVTVTSLLAANSSMDLMIGLSFLTAILEVMTPVYAEAKTIVARHQMPATKRNDDLLVVKSFP